MCVHVYMCVRGCVALGQLARRRTRQYTMLRFVRVVVDYINTYVCICMCLCVYVCAYVHARMFMFVHTLPRIRMCSYMMHAHKRIRAHLCAYDYIYICVHIYTYNCIQIYIYIHIYTYTCTYIYRKCNHLVQN